MALSKVFDDFFFIIFMASGTERLATVIFLRIYRSLDGPDR